MAKYLVNADLLFDIPSVDCNEHLQLAMNSIKILMDKFLDVTISNYVPGSRLVGYAEERVKCLVTNFKIEDGIIIDSVEADHESED
jgi:hypothetical protein